jgi:hypothetical protein
MSIEELLPGRRRLIEQIAKSVRDNYSDNLGEIEWEKLAKDRKIIIWEDERVFVAQTYPVKDYRVVCVSPYCKVFCGIDNKAHEFGHILLGHNSKMGKEQRETEADYFSLSLFGLLPENHSFFYDNFGLFKHPIAFYHSLFGNFPSYALRLAKRKLKRRQARKD